MHLADTTLTHNYYVNSWNKRMNFCPNEKHYVWEVTTTNGL
jgi:hypothetical protein